MADINYSEFLRTHENNLEMCSVCERRIPKEVERISFSVKTRYGYTYKRVCGYCLKKLAKTVNNKPVKDWAKQIFVTKI